LGSLPQCRDESAAEMQRQWKPAEAAEPASEAAEARGRRRGRLVRGDGELGSGETCVSSRSSPRSGD
jgi:hypothetical protein